MFQHLRPSLQPFLQLAPVRSRHLYFLATIATLSGFTGCKKEEAAPASVTALIDGKWKYQSNVGGGCNDLVGTVWDVKNGEATATYVPNNGFGFKTGEKMLSNIAQTTSPNNFTANGYSRSSGGAIADPNIVVTLAVATSAQSMTVVYKNVCNPVQVYVRTQ